MNFQDLYQKIKAIDEAGNPFSQAVQANPNAQIPMQQGDLDGRKKPSGWTADAETKFADLARQSQTPQVTKPSEPTAPQGNYHVVVSADGKLATVRSVATGDVVYGPTSPADAQAYADRTNAATAGRRIQENMEECGMMPMGGDHGQSDSVTMNISMNGSGSGGIRDLMNILRNIDNVGEPHANHSDDSADDLLFGVEGESATDGATSSGSIATVPRQAEEEFANAQAGAPGPESMPVAAVLSTGDDLASKGEERPKVNGGGNPMQENLKQHLNDLYQKIKEGAK